MKNIIFCSIIVILGLSGCMMFSGIRLKGDGNVTIEERPVSSFNKIKIDGVFKVHLTQGNAEKVEVEIDQNLQQYVNITNKETTLFIDFDKGVRLGKTTENNIYITLKEIDQLNISGVCTVTTRSTIQSDKLQLDVNGVSNSSLELKCNQLDAKITGVGNVELVGEAHEFTVKNSGVGNLTAENLKSDIVDIKNSGVGSTSVYASQELYLKNSGVGSIYYSGDAIIKAIESSGVGKITKSK